MSVVILGGNECMEQKYKSLCRDYRHEAKVMVKPVGGVKRKMGNPDLVIFFTGAMSHKMLQGALGEIKGQNVIVEYCPTSSVSALKKNWRSTPDVRGNDCTPGSADPGRNQNGQHVPVSL